MGTDDKNTGKDQPERPPKFDDFEDAFFATGEDSSFWLEEALAENAKTIIAGDEEVAERAAGAADAGAESAPAEEPAVVAVPDPSTPVPAPPVKPEPAVPASEVSPDEDSVEVAEPEPVQSTISAEPPEEEPEPYNPYAIHADPAALTNEDTEAWTMAEVDKLGVLDQETQIVEDPSAETIVDRAEAVTQTHAPRDPVTLVSAPVPADVPEAPTPEYEPAPGEAGWQEASVSLEREAAASSEPAAGGLLLAEAARIQLTRLGDWDEAARLFDAATQAGLEQSQAPRAYADVAASRGEFTRLMELLVARADANQGLVASEALQDAALVARNNLKEDDKAVELLNRALENGDDWFTLRLLRELHYRAGSWAELADVLTRMAGLAAGSQAARIWVEHGRIAESEIKDVDAAAVAYEQALASDPSDLEAFLAACRLAGARQDWGGLIELYGNEAERVGGSDAAFWRGRAARVARDASLDGGLIAGLYVAAAEAGGDCPTLRHEQQAWLRQEGRQADLCEALEAEAGATEGPERALAWYRLGQVQEVELGDAESAKSSYRAALEADPSAVPAAEAVGRLLGKDEDPSGLMEFLQTRLEAKTSAGVRAALSYRMGEIAETRQLDLEAAKAHYGAALELRPGAAAALMGLERVAAATEDWARLVETCLLRATHSGDPQVCAQSYTSAARACIDHLERADEGLEHLLKALRHLPDYSLALESAVVMLGLRERDADAADLLRAAAARTRTADSAVQYGYRAARLYAERCSDVDSAITCLNRCRELQPGFLPVIGFLSDLHVEAGRWDIVHDLRRDQAGIMGTVAGRDWELLGAAEAIQHVKGGDPEAVALEILDRSPGHPGALAMLEAAAQRTGDTARLLQVYGRMKRAADPARSVQLAARVVDLAQDLNDDGVTLRAVREIVDSNAVEGRPLAALARIAVSLDRWSDAHRALEAAGEDASTARARLLESYSEDQDAVVDAWRAILDSDEQNGEAASGLERALSRKNTREGLARVHACLADGTSDPSIRAMHSLLAGHLFEHQEDEAGALEYYEKAFRLRTIPGKAFDALVRIQCAAENADAVDELFDSLPGSSAAQRAQALEQAGAAERAAGIYRTVLAALPDDSPAHERLPLLLALEHSLGESEEWASASECLAQRAEICQSEEELTAIEHKRRWILAEKLADSDEAWDFYRKLHEDRPEDREVLEALARIAGARGETGLAIQFLDGLSKIAESSEEAARYQRRVAEVHLGAEALDEAREAFLCALDHSSDDVAAIEGLEALARQAEDWSALVGVLDRRIRITQGRAQVDLHREVARIWEVEIQDKGVAVDTWKRVLDMVPEDSEALAHLVGLSRERSQWPAFVEYGAALAPHCSAAERAGLLCELGEVALQQLKREEQAVGFLNRASTGEVISLEAGQWLERIHSKRGDWPQVVEALIRQARASEGGEAASLFLKAARTRRDALHDLRGAADIYDQVLKADPANPEALRYRGDHLFDEGELLQAAEIYGVLDAIEQDLDLDDFDVQMEQALFFFRFGECLRQTDQAEAALERYQGALDLNQSHLPTLEAIGPLFIGMERWEEAGGVFKQILQLTSGQGDSARLARVYTSLGQVEYAQGNEAKALKRFNKALELEANDVAALSGYAKILFGREEWNTLLNVYNNIIYHAKEPAEVIEAYMVKGFVLDAKMSLPGKAAQHFEKSLAFDPAQPVALLRLSELALRQEDWGQAASLAERALSLAEVDSDQGVQANLQLVRLIVARSQDDDAASSGACAAAISSDPELKAVIGTEMPDQEALLGLLRERLQAGL